MDSKPYGKLPDGAEVTLYTLSSSSARVTISSYGATITSIQVPDRKGKLADVILGFDSLQGYVDNNNHKGTAYFGATVGRYANRIAHGTFKLDAMTYTLAKNNGENSLHGGPHGFHNVMWNGKEIPNGVEFTYLSKDGEEGYPGNLSVAVRFVLSGSNLRIEYSANTDKDTVLNLTNHSYFNLTGATRDVLSHQLQLHASKFTPVDAGLIPIGEILPVKGTALDFTTQKEIGKDIDSKEEQIHLGGGFDHNWVLDRTGDQLSEAADVYEPISGRVLKVFTTEPGIQFYSGNFLDGTLKGHGTSYQKHYGFCLETQHFPDSPHHPNFPTTVLKPGQRFHSITEFRFSTLKGK